MRLDDFIEAANQVGTTHSLIELFEKALESLGVNKFVYTYMTHQEKIGHEAAPGIIKSYPEGWMKHYVENNYAVHDPTCKVALQSPYPFAWQDLQTAFDLSPRETQVMEEAKDAGIKNGISVSIHDPSGDVVGFGFASDDCHGSTSKTTLRKIHLLAHQFHMAYTDLYTKSPESIRLPEISLSDKERDVLFWCSRGKSNGVIADILGISEYTVNFHFRNIFRKLGTNSRMVAVLIAYRNRFMCL